MENSENIENTNNTQKYSGMSIAGFVLSLLLAPVGLVLSIVALVQQKKSKQKGKGLAIAGVIIGAVSTFLSVIMAVVYTPMLLNVLTEDVQIVMEQTFDPSADYVAELPVLNYEGETKVVQVKANRLDSTGAASEFDMEIPAEWMYDEDYDAYDVTLPSGEMALFSIYTIPSAEVTTASTGINFTSWLESDEAADMYEDQFGDFISDNDDFRIATKEAFIGVKTNNGFSPYVMFFVSQFEKRNTDVVFVIGVEFGIPTTESDFDWMIGNTKTAIISVLNNANAKDANL